MAEENEIKKMWIVVASFNKGRKEILRNHRIKIYDSIMTKPSLDYEKIDLTQSSEIKVTYGTKTCDYQVLINNHE